MEMYLLGKQGGWTLSSETIPANTAFGLVAYVKAQLPGTWGELREL